LGVPLCAYTDRSPYGLVPPDGARPLLQAYRAPGEALSAYATRVEQDIASFRQPVDLCVRAYTGLRSDGTHALSEQEVLDAMAETWRLACQYRVGALWFFADARRDGLPAHPSFREAIRAMRAAVPNWRDFPSRDPVPQPHHNPNPPIHPPASPASEDEIMTRGPKAHGNEMEQLIAVAATIVATAFDLSDDVRDRVIAQGARELKDIPAEQPTLVELVLSGFFYATFYGHNALAHFSADERAGRYRAMMADAYEQERLQRSR
jgi:hypothetical protein